MDPITIGWFIVPGAIAGVFGSVVGAAWNYFAGKDLRALESRLRKQEETYRLAQSPRVMAAIELWAEFCNYEKILGFILTPGRAATINAPSRQLEGAWSTVAAARAKAEVLLPDKTFAAFQDCFLQYEMAQADYVALNTLRGDVLGAEKVTDVAAQFENSMHASVAEAAKLRPFALRALQELVEPIGAK